MHFDKAIRLAGLCSVTAAAAALTACGGGGGDGGSNRAVALQPTAYVVFKAGEQATLAGAGAVTDSSSSGKTLSLGADGSTTLSASSGSAFAVAARGEDYQVVNRRDGAVLMLCDPLGSSNSPGDTHANYVAIATNSASADTQATPVTNALELAGKSFYVMGECSYLDDSQDVQGINAVPNGSTLEYRFDASGNVRGSDGWSVDAATFTGFLNGGFFVDLQGRKVWFSAYKFTVGNEQKIYFATRVEPLPGDQGYIGLWTDDASSDVVGCSLNCAKPADAVATTNANAVAGIYVTQYGFGEEASLVWVNGAGNYAYGLATAANSQVNAGLETGALAFDSSGTLTATKLYDTNGPGEAIKWSHNATQVVSTAVSDPARHFIGERVASDPQNPLIGAWALAACGSNTSINTTDPTQAFVAVYLKSGHYMILDTFGDVNNIAPIPGIEYGTFTQNATAGTFQHSTNRYDTNLLAGIWNSGQNAPNGTPRNYTISPDGNTMTTNAVGDGCGTATLVRIN